MTDQARDTDSRGAEGANGSEASGPPVMDYTFRSGDLLEVKSDVIATQNPRLELTRTEIFKDLD